MFISLPLPAIFLQAEQMVREQKADGILLLPNNLTQSLRRGETGGIGLYLSTTNFLKTKENWFRSSNLDRSYIKRIY